MVADPIAIAEAHWHIRFQKTGRNEYRSLNGCPICGDGGKGDRSDRLRLFVDGDRSRVWCRACDYKVFIDSLDKEKISADEWRIRAIERRQAELERKQREHEERLSALERIHRCQDHIGYHRFMTEQNRGWWHEQGIYDQAIDKFMLGFCPRCPTDTEHRPSFTIPVMRGGQLENIRHRIANVEGGNKYRPHMAGLGLQLFNADVLDEKPTRVLIVEGEKKTMVFDQYGYPAVGILGKSSWYKAWIPWFDGVKEIVIALDPDAQDSAWNLAGILGERCRVAQFPQKPDDFIIQNNAGSRDIDAILRLARPMRQGRAQ